MSFLFIVTDETSRRSILPIVDIFIQNKINCKILINHFCVNNCLSYSSYFIDEAEATKLNWKFIVCTNPIPKNKFKGRVASVAHGSMFGNNAWSLNRAVNADLYFGISPQELPYIKHYLKDKFKEDNFIATGCPANDFLINFTNLNHQVRTKKRQFFALKDERTILLSSHWTSLGNLRKFGTGLLDAITWNFPEHQVICTCHPKLITSPKDEFRIFKPVNTPHFDAEPLIRLLKSRQNNKVKVIFTEATPEELLCISDIFVGDNSSLVAQASFFRMPLIINSKNSYYDQTISKIISSDTHQFNNIEELIGNLRYVDESDNPGIKVGNKIRKLFMYNVGFSAQSIFNNLNSIN